MVHQVLLKTLPHQSLDHNSLSSAHLGHFEHHPLGGRHQTDHLTEVYMHIIAQMIHKHN